MFAKVIQAFYSNREQSELKGESYEQSFIWEVSNQAVWLVDKEQSEAQEELYKALSKPTGLRESDFLRG